MGLRLGRSSFAACLCSRSAAAGLGRLRLSMLAGMACCQHCHGGGEHGAAHTETEHIDLRRLADILNRAHCLEYAVFDVVVPALVAQAFVGISPADHKGAMPLADGIANDGVVRLQVQNVELVDAGRHHQKRLFEYLGSQRLVFDELEQLVLENHSAFGGRHVLAHGEQAFVGHGDMTLAHVGQQIGNALSQALALGFNNLVERIGVQCQKIAGRHGCHPLLHRKTHPVACFLIALNRFGHAGQHATAQQVVGRGHRCNGIGAPLGLGKALVPGQQGLNLLAIRERLH